MNIKTMRGKSRLDIEATLIEDARYVYKIPVELAMKIGLILPYKNRVSEGYLVNKKVRELKTIDEASSLYLRFLEEHPNYNVYERARIHKNYISKLLIHNSLNNLMTNLVKDKNIKGISLMLTNRYITLDRERIFKLLELKHVEATQKIRSIDTAPESLVSSAKLLTYLFDANKNIVALVVSIGYYRYLVKGDRVDEFKQIPFLVDKDNPSGVKIRLITK